MQQMARSIAVLIFVGCSSTAAWPHQNKPSPLQDPVGQKTSGESNAKRGETETISFFPADERWLELDRQKWNHLNQKSEGVQREPRRRPYVPINSLTFMTANNKIAPVDWYSSNASDIRQHIAGSKLAGHRKPDAQETSSTTSNTPKFTTYHTTEKPFTASTYTFSEASKITQYIQPSIKRTTTTTTGPTKFLLFYTTTKKPASSNVFPITQRSKFSTTPKFIKSHITPYPGIRGSGLSYSTYKQNLRKTTALPPKRNTFQPETPTKVITFIPVLDKTTKAPYTIIAPITSRPKSKSPSMLSTWRPLNRQSSSTPYSLYTTKRPALFHFPGTATPDSTSSVKLTTETPQSTFTTPSKTTTKINTFKSPDRLVTRPTKSKPTTIDYITAQNFLQTKYPDNYSSNLNGYQSTIPPTVKSKKPSSSIPVKNLPVRNNIRNKNNHRIPSVNVTQKPTLAPLPISDKLVLHEAISILKRQDVKQTFPKNTSKEETLSSSVTEKPIHFIENPGTVGLSEQAFGEPQNEENDVVWSTRINGITESIAKEELSTNTIPSTRPTRGPPRPSAPYYIRFTTSGPRTSIPSTYNLQAYSGQYEGQSDGTKETQLQPILNKVDGEGYFTQNHIDHTIIFTTPAPLTPEDNSYSDYEYDFFEDELSEYYAIYDSSFGQGNVQPLTSEAPDIHHPGFPNFQTLTWPYSGSRPTQSQSLPLFPDHYSSNSLDKSEFTESQIQPNLPFLIPYDSTVSSSLPSPTNSPDVLNPVFISMFDLNKKFPSITQKFKPIDDDNSSFDKKQSHNPHKFQINQESSQSYLENKPSIANTPLKVNLYKTVSKSDHQEPKVDLFHIFNPYDTELSNAGFLDTAYIPTVPTSTSSTTRAPPFIYSSVKTDGTKDAIPSSDINTFAALNPLNPQKSAYSSKLNDLIHVNMFPGISMINHIGLLSQISHSYVPPLKKRSTLLPQESVTAETPSNMKLAGDYLDLFPPTLDSTETLDKINTDTLLEAISNHSKITNLNAVDLVVRNGSKNESQLHHKNEISFTFDILSNLTHNKTDQNITSTPLSVTDYNSRSSLSPFSSASMPNSTTDRLVPTLAQRHRPLTIEYSYLNLDGFINESAKVSNSKRPSGGFLRPLNSTPFPIPTFSTDSYILKRQTTFLPNPPTQTIFDLGHDKRQNSYLSSFNYLHSLHSSPLSQNDNKIPYRNDSSHHLNISSQSESGTEFLFADSLKENDDTVLVFSNRIGNLDIFSNYTHSSKVSDSEDIINFPHVEQNLTYDGQYDYIPSSINHSLLPSTTVTDSDHSLHSNVTTISFSTDDPSIQFADTGVNQDYNNPGSSVVDQNSINSDLGPHREVMVKVWKMVDGQLSLVREQPVPIALFQNTSLVNGAVVNPQDVPPKVMSMVATSLQDHHPLLNPELYYNSRTRRSAGKDEHQEKDSVFVKDSDLKDKEISSVNIRYHEHSISSELNSQADKVRNYENRTDQYNVNPHPIVTEWHPQNLHKLLQIRDTNPEQLSLQNKDQSSKTETDEHKNMEKQEFSLPQSSEGNTPNSQNLLGTNKPFQVGVSNESIQLQQMNEARSASLLSGLSHKDTFFGGVGNPNYSNLPLDIGTALEETDINYLQTLSRYASQIANFANADPTIEALLKSPHAPPLRHQRPTVLTSSDNNVNTAINSALGGTQINTEGRNDVGQLPSSLIGHQGSVLEFLPHDLPHVNPLVASNEKPVNNPVDLGKLLTSLPSSSTLTREQLKSTLASITGTNTFSGHLGNQGLVSQNNHAAQNSHSGNNEETGIRSFMTDRRFQQPVPTRDNEPYYPFAYQAETSPTSDTEFHLSNHAQTTFQTPQSQNIQPALSPIAHDQFSQTLFQSSGQQPAFQSSGQQPAFPSSGQQPVFSSSGQQPVFSSSGQQATFPSSGQQPSFPSSGQQPGFFSSGQQPVFFNSGQQHGFHNSEQQPSFPNSGQPSNFANPNVPFANPVQQQRPSIMAQMQFQQPLGTNPVRIPPFSALLNQLQSSPPSPLSPSSQDLPLFGISNYPTPLLDFLFNNISTPVNDPQPNIRFPLQHAGQLDPNIPYIPANKPVIRPASFEDLFAEPTGSGNTNPLLNGQQSLIVPIVPVGATSGSGSATANCQSNTLCILGLAGLASLGIAQAMVLPFLAGRRRKRRNALDITADIESMSELLDPKHQFHSILDHVHGLRKISKLRRDANFDNTSHSAYSKNLPHVTITSAKPFDTGKEKRTEEPLEELFYSLSQELQVSLMRYALQILTQSSLNSKESLSQ